jgi:hypothetical protein
LLKKNEQFLKEMSLVEQHTCPCNPLFVYKTKSTFNCHKKSKKHIAFETKRKEEAIAATRRDNEIDLLNRLLDKKTREFIALEEKFEKKTREFIALEEKFEKKKRMVMVR